MNKGKFSDALTLYKNSLICMLRVIGSEHLKTAEIYNDIGLIY